MLPLPEFVPILESVTCRLDLSPSSTRGQSRKFFGPGSKRSDLAHGKTSVLFANLRSGVCTQTCRMGQIVDLHLARVAPPLSDSFR
jgi:hypothetical protein